MSIQTTYSHAKANLAELWDQVTQNRETVIIKRRGAEDVAMISASELSGILETCYLMKSPANARRLMRAMNRADAGLVEPESIEDLKRSIVLTDRKKKPGKQKREAVFHKRN